MMSRRHVQLLQLGPYRPSIAETIPPELFERILAYVCEAAKKHTYNTFRGKSHISSCALVCRYWARLGRRLLFEDLDLRNRDDVYQLGSILDAPAIAGLEPVSQIVQDLVAFPNVDEYPWLHHVYHLVLSKLRRNVASDFRVVFQESPTSYTLHPGLPRSPPQITMPIEDLALVAVRFKSGRTLARLISSVPTLLRLGLQQVTFDTKPAATEFFIPPFGRKLWLVMSFHDQLCVEFLPSLVANTPYEGRSARVHAGRVSKYVVDGEEVKILRRLFALFRPARGKFEIQHNTSPSEDYVSVLHLICRERFSAGDLGTNIIPPIRIYLGIPRVHTLLHVNAPADAPTPTMLHVHKLEIDLTANLNDDVVREVFDELLWTRFAELATKVSQLETVHVIRPRAYARLANMHEPSFWGMSDIAFRPFIKQNKFGSGLVDENGTVTHWHTQALTCECCSLGPVVVEEQVESDSEWEDTSEDSD